MTLSYGKKPATGDMSEFGAESTTIGLTSQDGESPLIGKQRQGLSLDPSRQLNPLQAVSEYPSTANHVEYSNSIF